jgi:phage tail sheath protein FI
MAVTVTYPGVYIHEEPSGARAIAGVATSIAMFIGMAQRGRMNQPIRIFSFADFEREFGPTTTGELADQVRQFYVSGGSDAWVCRAAHGFHFAAVTLRSESGADALTVTARDPGIEGNLIRVEVDYDTASAERSFNLTLYRSRLQADGTRTRENEESFKALSMDPESGNYVESVINGASGLVTVTAQQANAPAAGGVSIAGRILPAVEANVEVALTPIVTNVANAIRISVDNNPPVTATLAEMGAIANANQVANIAAQWQADINGALTANGLAAVVVVEITDAGVGNDSVDNGRLLRISSVNGPVVVTPATVNDVSVALALGAAAGGIEGDNFGDFRPAPTGLVSRMGTSVDGFAAFRRFASAQRATLTDFNLVDDSPDTPHGAGVVIAPGAGLMYEQGGTSSLRNARGALDVLAAILDANTHARWHSSRTGFRLALRPRYGAENTGLAGILTTGGGFNIGAAGEPFDPASNPANVAAYTVGQPGGVAGLGQFQTASAQGIDGTPPLPADYAAIYATIDREVDLFNLLILPRADGQSDDDRQALWGPASAFCAVKRAFLIMDPRRDWTTITAASLGVDQARIGVETRNTAVYWPRLRVANGTPAGKKIDPAGSMAGLYARIDGNRGVWKAPAGLEATIRGVIGVERRMSDPENGVINPAALNAIRVFPAGVVSWGARTLVGFDGSGNIDDKYVPVRRTMLFIEESLYRGLKFAVFEPNDEPLWAQIRLAAGSFMNGLFRQGAFAGAKASDAYFVLCDSTTTTANDINLGIVNVIVGFAPLKPAEFVIITVKQIAGQVQI